MTANSNEPENVCEHGDHPAPDGKRFCSDACARCEQESNTETGCDNICGRASFVRPVRDCWVFFLIRKGAQPRPLYISDEKEKPEPISEGEWIRMVEAQAPAPGREELVYDVDVGEYGKTEVFGYRKDGVIYITNQKFIPPEKPNLGTEGGPEAPETVRLIALLRRLEWIETDERGHYCEICGSAGWIRWAECRHKPDCALAATIRALEAAPASVRPSEAEPSPNPKPCTRHGHWNQGCDFCNAYWLFNQPPKKETP